MSDSHIYCNQGKNIEHRVSDELDKDVFIDFIEGGARNILETITELLRWELKECDDKYKYILPENGVKLDFVYSDFGVYDIDFWFKVSISEQGKDEEIFNGRILVDINFYTVTVYSDDCNFEYDFDDPSEWGNEKNYESVHGYMTSFHKALDVYGAVYEGDEERRVIAAKRIVYIEG